MAGENAVQLVDTLATLLVFAVLAYVIIEALEAAPLGFETQIDDTIENSYDTVRGWT